MIVTAAEPRVRHTARCDEARSCGHPAAFCICSELDRLHDDWRALTAVVRVAKDYVPAVNMPDFAGLLGLARSRAALDDFHERIRRQALAHALADGSITPEAAIGAGCLICKREEDGP